MHEIRLFAGFAEFAKASQVALPLPEHATVYDVRLAVKDRFPALESEVDRALIAVNQTYARDDVVIVEGDEIALIPPVGGGLPMPDENKPQSAWPLCHITQQPLVVEQAYRQLEHPKYGGTVLFCGSVREWTRGRQTAYLAYEAYTEMALAQMERIAAEATRQWPDTTLLQWHRIGRIDPTEIAVICAAASPHRPAAFEAARYLIEQLKKDVPIWKKEVFLDGDTHWQANP